MLNKENYRYKAFISYRHCDGDRDWAKWVHHSLESMIIPKHIRIKYDHDNKRMGRLFRDEEELPASPNLSDSISNALKESEFLIVICSPNLPKSKWCSAEIAQFRALGRQDNIIALLIDGEPEQAFPKELTSYIKQVKAESGEIIEEQVTVEPLAADVRPRKDETARQLKYKAKMRLASVLLSCEFDEIIQRDRQRRKKNSWIYSVITSLIIISLTVLGWLQLKVAEEKDNLNTSIGISSGLIAIEEKRYDLAKLLFLSSNPGNYKGDRDYQYLFQMMDALRYDRLLGVLWTHKQKASDQSEYQLPNISFTESGELAVNVSDTNWWESLDRTTQIEKDSENTQYYDTKSFKPSTKSSDKLVSTRSDWQDSAYFLDFNNRKHEGTKGEGTIIYNSTSNSILVNKNNVNYSWATNARIEGAWLIQFPLVMTFEESGRINLVNLKTQESNRIPNKFDSFKSLELSLRKTSKNDKVFALIQNKGGVLALDISDVSKQEKLSYFSVQPKEEFYQISVSPSGNLLALLLKNSEVQIYSLKDKSLHSTFSLSRDLHFVTQLEFNAKESLLAVAAVEEPIGHKQDGDTRKETYFVTSLWDVTDNQVTNDTKLKDLRAFSDIKNPEFAEWIEMEDELKFELVLMTSEPLMKLFFEHLTNILAAGRTCLTEREIGSYLSADVWEKERDSWNIERCKN